MYIILEYLLLENFIINFFILYITKIITRTKGKIKNIVLGAFISSLYSLVFFHHSLLFLTGFFAKIIISMIIIKISFNSKDLKLFIKEIFGFYVVSFVFAGATIGVYYSDINFNSLTKLLKNINGIFPVKYLVVGVSLSIILAKLLFDYHNKKIHKESYIIEVKIFYKDKIAKVDALIDTGNSLSVPFTNNPVFIVEYEKIKELLPLVISDLFYSYENDDFYTFEKLLREIEKEVLIKLIPYKSIGNNKGVLFGFKPDFLLMNINGSSEVKKDNYYIGIYNGVLSHDLSFNGLLHYDTMRQEETV